MDGPVHATLRDAVRTRRLRGWALVLLGTAGIIVSLAMNAEADAVYGLVLAAVFTSIAWWFDGRASRRGLATIRPATAEATIVSIAPARLLTGPVLLAALIVACILTGIAAAPVSIALGVGANDLIIAGMLGRWERRAGKRLFVAGDELYSR